MAEEDFNYRPTDWRRYVEYRLNETKNGLKEINGKMDKLLSNSKGFVTTESMDKAIETHSKVCPTANPGNQSTVQLVKDNGKLLGIIGGLVGAISLLIQVLFKT